MDGYFFIRYLSMCLKIFFPMALIILPILIPLNVTDGKGTSTIEGVKYNVTGLDKLAWSNVSPDRTDRYWAHLVLAVVVIAWVCFIFHRELIHYIKKRQEYLSHPSHRLKASATSVLITDIPSHLCTVDKLTEHYDDLSGGLRRIWINRDFRPLLKLVKQRGDLEDKLENAETNLIRYCVKKSKKLKGKTKTEENGQNRSGSMQGDGHQGESYQGEDHQDIHRLDDPTGSDEHILGPQERTLKSRPTQTDWKNDLQHDIDTKALWTRYMSPNKRSKMRVPSQNHTTLFKIPLIGRLFGVKVDTIYYCRRELARLNVEIEKEVETADTCPNVHSAFLQFNTQKAAHLACQGLSHPHPNYMTQRTLELAPADIDWPNLRISWWERNLRFAGFLFLFLLFLFLFGIISVFTGILSKVSTLSASRPWLDWIASLPPWLLSFIQGTLPPVILIVVLSGPLPIFLRMFSNDVRGATTGSRGERSLQLWYFIFLLVELFLIPTISSGLTAVVRDLVQNPSSVPNILATNLPTAANYYFSFLIVEALSISASSILQTIRLLNYYVLGSTNTPDSVFNSLTFTNRTRIGSNIPWYTTYAVIGLVYSVIAPLMLVFMLITFSLFWFVIKNNILYVVRTGNVDGGGLFFPEAINQTFTGLYFMEVCLIGLFFLVRDAQDNVVCEAQGIIMAIALVCTVLYQWWLYSTLNPLYVYLPITMEGDAKQRDREYEMERLRPQQEDDEEEEKHREITDPVVVVDGDRFVDAPETKRRQAGRQQTGGVDGAGDGDADGDGQTRDRGTDKGIYNEGGANTEHRDSKLVDDKNGQDATTGTGNKESQNEIPEKSPVTPSSPQHHHQHSAAETVSEYTARRSSRMQEQQEHDAKSARRILARLNRPLTEGIHGEGIHDETTSESEERPAQLDGNSTRLARRIAPVGATLLPRQAEVEKQMTDDPISKIIMQHNDELEDLNSQERDLLVSVAFTHPVLRMSRPCVWIPEDEIGVSNDEVSRTRQLSKEIRIENKGAFLEQGKKLRVGVDAAPPDMSQFALLMAEL